MRVFVFYSIIHVFLCATVGCKAPQEVGSATVAGAGSALGASTAGASTASGTSLPSEVNSASDASDISDASDFPTALREDALVPVSSAEVAVSDALTKHSAGAELLSDPLPAVQVRNIGMHIGGGPNDQVSKQPIADSVKPHFDALRACWKHVGDQTKQGDFGVDLLIPREGGRAEVSHPRTAVKGEGFEECVVGVFANIDFLKPRTGRTMVSYSVRFTP